MTDALEELTLQSSAWGIPLGRSQLTQLAAYADLLTNYQVANVIGTRERSRIILEHLTDSLSCCQAQDLWRANTLVDIGSGGGLPGIPLAIVRPELHVTLLEASEKKVRFLSLARSALNLRNVEVLRARAEEAGRQSALREAFDLTVTRALASLPVVLEYSAPLVRLGGTILAMKGKLSEEELSQAIDASRPLGTAIREMQEIQYHPRLPHKDRWLILFDKARLTSGKFPRRPGLAKKRPLGQSSKLSDLGPEPR